MNCRKFKYLLYKNLFIDMQIDNNNYHFKSYKDAIKKLEELSNE